MVSGSHFLPKAPLTWVKSIPALRDASRKVTSGREGGEEALVELRSAGAAPAVRPSGARFSCRQAPPASRSTADRSRSERRFRIHGLGENGGHDSRKETCA